MSAWLILWPRGQMRLSPWTVVAGESSSLRWYPMSVASSVKRMSSAACPNAMVPAGRSVLRVVARSWSLCRQYSRAALFSLSCQWLSGSLVTVAVPLADWVGAGWSAGCGRPSPPAPPCKRCVQLRAFSVRPNAGWSPWRKSRARYSTPPMVVAAPRSARRGNPARSSSSHPSASAIDTHLGMPASSFAGLRTWYLEWVGVGGSTGWWSDAPSQARTRVCGTPYCSECRSFVQVW